jgi:hypothetical protein
MGDRRKLATYPARHGVGQGHLLRSAEDRAKNGGIRDCTSNSGGIAACYQGNGKGDVHRRYLPGDVEREAISRREDANGSKPSRSPNCVHYVSEPVGEHLKYLVWAGCPPDRRPIACLAWSSAPRHLGSRDRYIGWSATARPRNIRFLAYNTRFLILPWVRVEHLASHILGRMAAQISTDWQRMYGHPIYFLETFVDPERFRGTCYRAANWVMMGQTTGRGKQSNSYVPNRSIKEVLGYPLSRRFRQLLEQ